MRVHGKVAFKVMGLVVICGLLVYWYSASDGRIAESDNYGESRLGSPARNGPDTRAEPSRSSNRTISESRVRASGANEKRVQQTQRDREKGGVLPLEQDVRESDHHWNQNRRTSATMEPHLVDNSSLNLEVATVLNRIDTCLVATNMSDYFKKNGYYSMAKENAETVLRALRKIVPEFQTPYKVPCWKTAFKAVWEGVSSTNLQKKQFPKQSAISGYIGAFNFSYGTNDGALNNILRDVQWERKLALQYKLSVACLPKLFLLGYPKCGSTFIFCLLRRILMVDTKMCSSCEATKEPHWWVARRHIVSRLPDYLALYLLNFGEGAKYVERSRHAVTIDATLNMMYQWPRYTEEETMENYCLIPSLVPVLLPDSKYFVVMRNPVTMLYSAFWYSCTDPHRQAIMPVKYKGPDIFHERITRKIEIFNQCKAVGEPLDKCMDAVSGDIYGPDLPVCGRSQLQIGLYYVHTRKWLSIVPREQIRFFTLEELVTQDLKYTAKVILDFLDFGEFKVHGSLSNCRKNEQSAIDYTHDPRLMMRNDTRQILVEFFKPYNQMLANLLGDDKFLWNDGH